MAAVKDDNSLFTLVIANRTDYWSLMGGMCLKSAAILVNEYTVRFTRYIPFVVNTFID